MELFAPLERETFLPLLEEARLNWEIRERALPVRHAKWSRQFDELEIV